MNSSARIFISYRRGDTRWVAGRLYDRLVAALGDNSIFLDVTNIELGRDFVETIQDVISACDVVLVLIGKDWLSATTDTGKRRLEDTRDLMRIEIAAALERKIRVIPILIDGAVMPESELLPPDLSSLARRNARQMHFETFHSDVDSFIRVLERILAGPSAPPQTVAEAKEESEKESTASVATQLPFTVSLETLGGVATPLIRKGSSLPAEGGEVFSTATDNQTSVEIKLFAGERSMSADNFAIGTFQLQGIPPAPAKIPQIRLRATVDPSLILVVAAEDLGTGRREVLDAVDLTKVTLPDSAKLPSRDKVDPPGNVGVCPECGGAGTVTHAAGAMKFKLTCPRCDGTGRGQKTPSGDDHEQHRFDFSGFDFSELFGKGSKDVSDTSLDAEIRLSISKSEAKSGIERTVIAPKGSITVRIPPGATSGKRLRVRGQGLEHAGKRGDLYILITVGK